MAVAVSASRNGAQARYLAGLESSSVVEYGTRRAIVTLAIVIATLLEIVDVTIVNVALPNIQGNFGAGIDQAAWIGTGYIIANVIVIPITPWLQQRFGRRQYYAASIAIFTVASLMCGLSGSLTQLVFWRIVQGLGGGGLISTSQAILRETYPSSEQGKAAAIFSMGVIVGPTIGPTLGGIITDQLSWRWAFFINLPLGILAFVLVLMFLRNPQAPRRIPLDGVGLALLAVGIGSLQYVLDQGQQKDWLTDGSIVAFSLIAIAGLAAFVFWELRNRRPIVDLHVLRYRSVAAGSSLGLALGVSLYGSVLILPQYVQGSLGFTATMSGELLIMRAGAIMLFTPLAAALATRGKIDPRLFIACGFLLLGISNLMLANVTTTDTGFWTFFWSLAISGLGLAQIFVPLTISVLGSVGPKDIPAASAFFNLSRQIGGSIAIAVLITILVRSTEAHREQLSAAVTLRSPAVAQLVQRSGSQAAATPTLRALVDQQALVLAYADTARATAAITFLLAPCVLLMRRPRSRTA
jgi:MFS transporter, DHA2 family, multidrug resistance protein